MNKTLLILPAVLTSLVALTFSSLVVFTSAQSPPLPPSPGIVSKPETPKRKVIAAVDTPPVMSYFSEVRTNPVVQVRDITGMANFGRPDNRPYPRTNSFTEYFQVVSNHIVEVVFKGTTNVFVEEKAVLLKYHEEVTEILTLSTNRRSKTVIEP